MIPFAPSTAGRARHRAPHRNRTGPAPVAGRGRHAADRHRGAPGWNREDHDPRVDGDLLEWLGFAPVAGG
ncbi:hypothetical protein GCU56_15220 [Geodermatophilus sabuli]|uniref:Uncharacterized protein n=1 Tax=Geodermatophilus sabuli TaxID=1564158 RepID=A0A7K3W2V4_9ACTN|nr:hypothetical protein [Geodermatophilus sabuli]NEK59216.1 hypothetical protein [Geodermatophilus sabuli]